MAKEKKKKGSIVINIFIILLFLVGAGIFTYPTISNYWNEYRNAQLVTKYNESVSDLSDDQYEKLWQEAEEYNAEHKVPEENFPPDDPHPCSKPLLPLCGRLGF